MGYLSINNISFSYGKLKALDNASFEVRKGEIFGLIGSNGCGKSTMLKILCGLLNPVRGGKILLSNQEIKPEKVKNMIGYCPQENSFFDKLTVKENLMYFSYLYNIRHKSDDKIMGLLRSVDLSDKVNELACNLSGGMKRRLNIACGILHDPQILLMDEPSIELDPDSRTMVWNLITSIRDSGKTIILATNLMEEAKMLCNRIGLMEKGYIVAEGEVKKVWSKK